MRCSRADDAQAAKYDGSSCSGSAEKRGRGAWPRSPMACFRRLPLRLFGGMQEAHSLVLARLQAPQTLHRSWASYGCRRSGSDDTRPFLRSAAPRLFWARSTLAVVAPSGSAAAAAQGRQLLAGEEEEEEEEEAVAEQRERQRWDGAGAGGTAGRSRAYTCQSSRAKKRAGCWYRCRQKHASGRGPEIQMRASRRWKKVRLQTACLLPGREAAAAAAAAAAACVRLRVLDCIVY